MTEFFELIQSIADFFVYGLTMLLSLFTLCIDAFNYLFQTLVLMPEYIMWSVSILTGLSVILFILDRG